jgi:hypothetical protein
MIEITLPQRLVLFLGHPVSSVAVGLASLLLLCGLGSLASERIARFLAAKAMRRVGTTVLASPEQMRFAGER